MQEIHLNTIQDFNDYNGMETLHPLVSVLHVDSTEHIQKCVMHYGLYALYLKETKGCKLSYGRTPYDFDEMTVTSFAPGQVVTVEPNPDVPFAKYTALAFHPDLLNQEVEVFQGVLSMIEQELHHAIDRHTRELIVSNIELLLNYCLRFYDRQFITREEVNHGVVRQFIALLDDYIATHAQRDGLPSVAWFADKCCLSTGYFGTLVKTETGRAARDIIADRLLDHARRLLNDETLTVAMVSNRLGFDYPQHFVRFFKAHTGMTPSAYRRAS